MYEVTSLAGARSFETRRIDAFRRARRLAEADGWAEVYDVIAGERFVFHANGAPCLATPEERLLAAIFDRPCCMHAPVAEGVH
jgi:hypothetical protein